MTDRVLVGFDGSDGAATAVRWAAETARRLDVPLVVVRSWEFTPLVAITDAPTDPTELREAVERATHRELAAVIGDGAPPAEVRVLEGDAVEILVDSATPTDLIVVGSRGHGSFKGLLLGSVSQKVAQHAPCPVTIVRSPH